MKTKAILILMGMIVLAIFFAGITTQNPTKDIKISEIPIKTYEGKKVLYINSYHAGYVFRMDTKRNDSETFGKQAGMRAQSIIDDFKPDVVIISDDSAFKYVLMPYYRNATLPFVFCGINWDNGI